MAMVWWLANLHHQPVYDIYIIFIIILSLILAWNIISKLTQANTVSSITTNNQLQIYKKNCPEFWNLNTAKYVCLTVWANLLVSLTFVWSIILHEKGRKPPKPLFQEEILWWNIDQRKGLTPNMSICPIIYPSTGKIDRSKNLVRVKWDWTHDLSSHC